MCGCGKEIKSNGLLSITLSRKGDRALSLLLGVRSHTFMFHYFHKWLVYVRSEWSLSLSPLHTKSDETFVVVVGKH